MPSTYALKTQIQDVFDAAYKLVNTAEQAGRPLTPEEEGRFEQLMSQGQRLRLDLERTDVAGLPVPAAPGRLHYDSVNQVEYYDMDELTPEQQRQHRAGWYGTPPEGVTIPDLPRRYAPGAGRDPRRMQALFGPCAASPWPLREFLHCVTHNLHDPRLQVSAAMGEGSGPAGGFLVPQELVYQVLDEALTREIVRPRCRVEPMTSKTKTIATYDGQNQQQTLYGFRFGWLAEHEEATAGDGKVRALTLNAYVGAIYLDVSMELSMDAPGFEQDLSGRLIAATANSLDTSFFFGTGAGQPLGLFNAGATLTVAPESGQQSGTITWTNVVSMFARSSAPETAVWVCSKTALPALMSLTITIGTGGSYIPAVVQGANGTMSLLTRPLLMSDKLPTLGNTGDLALLSLESYVIGLRREMSIDVSNAPGFMRRENTWRCLVRVDGQPLISQPFVGHDGQQYSPFVLLGPRP